jgi:general secretion pathway protein G
MNRIASPSSRAIQRGFTLIEIMVVVVILGILAALVVPKIIDKPDQARLVRAKQDINAVQSALDLYRLDSGTYPTTDQGLQALVTQPTITPIPQNWHQYLHELPMDPWGQAYHYLNPGVHGDVDIFTYGPTGKPGGSGKNAEIGNWTPQAT